MISADPPKTSEAAAVTAPAAAPTSSAFSYAQAAKGKSTTSVPNTSTASASNASNTPAEQVDQTEKASISTDLATPATEGPHDLNSDAPLTGSDDKSVEHAPQVDADTLSKTSADKNSQTGQAEGTSRLDRPWRRNDRGTRSSSTATKDDSDSRRKRNKKGKNAEKQSSDQASIEKAQEKEPEPPKVPLSEAPIPTVNPWQQRKEALTSSSSAASTLSTTAPTASTDTVAAPPKNVTASTATTTTAAATPASEVSSSPSDTVVGTKSLENGVGASASGKTSRKAADTQRSEKNGIRAQRDAKSVIPPPVEDARAWPTPESAITEDKKKPAVEKAERSEKDKESDDGQPKSKKKNEWVTYDYVPTVSFETQLPNMRGSKPRAPRGTNGPRSSSANAHGGDKPTNATAVKNGESKERPRDPAQTPTEVASSQHANKRSSADASASREPRKASSQLTHDKSKDSAAMSQTEPSQQPPRERHESRNDRGRGGYRGRGSHNAANPHSRGASINTSAFPPTAGMGTRSHHGHYSPPPRAGGGHGQMYPPPPQRGGRGGRNASSNNYQRMSLPNGRLGPVQTQFPASYEFPIAPMTAIPYQPQPYMDSMIAATLKHQVEYYFSVENLCKDVFLRKRMDSQGFVPLHFVAGFRRVRELSQDLNLLRAVCEDSTEIDFVIGEDDGERLRRRHGWEKFVMPLEDRDELARSHGPMHLNHRNRHYGFGQQAPFNGMPSMAFAVSSPPAYAAQGDQQALQFPDNVRNGHSAPMMTNGHVNGIGNATPLSAEVPDFAPSGGKTMHNFGKQVPDFTPGVQVSENSGVNGLVNGHGQANSSRP